MPRHNDMRCEGDMVVNEAMVTQMVATPEYNVVADACEGLQRVVFQYEAVFADFIIEHCGLGTDVADHPVALRTDFVENAFPVTVHVFGRHGGKKMEIFRRVGLRDIFKGKHRQPFEVMVFRNVGFVYTKGRYIVRRVIFQVIAGEFSVVL